VKRGGGNVILDSTENSFAYSDGSCVALPGVKDIVVVVTEDAALVTSKGQWQRPCAQAHNRVYRPWGWY
jgi:hypothetical protein